MRDESETERQLVKELAEMRQRIAELEASETGRRRAERAVQEAREYAESIVETVREPLVVLDADIRVVSASRSFYSVFQVTPEEAQGQLLYGLGNRQWDIPALRKLLEEILPENTTFDDFEVEHDFETIGRRIMLLNARRIYREANEAQLVLLAIEDSTERKQAEERIEHLNDVLRAIRNVNQLIVLEKDRDRLLQGACDNLVETRGYYSAWIALLDEGGGFVTSAEAGLGEEFLPMVERLKRGELPDCARRALSRSEVVTTEDPLSTCTNCPLAANYGDGGGMTVRLEHGGRVYGLMSVSIRRDRIADEEEKILFQEVAADIAFALHSIEQEKERARAEEALKEYSERLEEMVEERSRELQGAQEQLIRQEKLAVLGQLAGGVGHELRNPLGAIKNAAYFLNMVLEEPEPEVKETLEILEREVGTSERIIGSLLDFARASPPTRRKVDLNGVVQEALSRTAAPCQGHGTGVPQHVEVVRELDEALPDILADPDQLVQVFGNIILNAVQAMPEGGRLVVKTSEVSGKPPRSREVAVSFADTGTGIAEENLGKVFEPLFTTKAKGIGLGLAVTRTLVEGHGGSIKVESTVEEGSTFTVRLPVSTGEGK
jgi:PAS domain S-box-containing protein